MSDPVKGLLFNVYCVCQCNVDRNHMFPAHKNSSIVLAYRTFGNMVEITFGFGLYSVVIVTVDKVHSIYWENGTEQ